MGSLQAQEFASATAAGAIQLEAALHWHLTANHYPPHPAYMVKPARLALALYQAEEYQAQIDLGEYGVTHRRYGQYIPVHAFIEELHLEAFADWDLGEDIYAQAQALLEAGNGVQD